MTVEHVPPIHQNNIVCYFLSIGMAGEGFDWNFKFSVFMIFEHQKNNKQPVLLKDCSACSTHSTKNVIYYFLFDLAAEGFVKFRISDPYQRGACPAWCFITPSNCQ